MSAGGGGDVLQTIKYVYDGSDLRRVETDLNRMNAANVRAAESTDKITAAQRRFAASVKEQQRRQREAAQIYRAE